VRECSYGVPSKDNLTLLNIPDFFKEVGDMLCHSLGFGL
jgi:hypothetical protein